MDLNYEEDLHIDETALDLEWLNQPMRIMAYSKALAKAEKRVSRLKEKLSVSEAVLDREIRMHPEKFKVDNVPKLTEAVVGGCILTDSDHKEEVKELINAQHKVKIMKGAVEAFQHRKASLENLVKLHGQQYFAGPKVPRDLKREVIDKKAKERMIDTVKITKKNRRRKS